MLSGFRGNHFNQPKFSYYQIPDLTQEIRWNANVGISCNLTDALNFMIQGNHAYQGTYTEAIFGGLIKWTAERENLQEAIAFSFGAFYRYGDAVIPVVKVRRKKLSLALSYDINISSLKDASNMAGGYEVSLFFSGNYSNDDGRLKVCPKF